MVAAAFPGPYNPDKELFTPEDLTAKLFKPPELNSKKSRS